jgi:hypothetical protein
MLLLLSVLLAGSPAAGGHALAQESGASQQGSSTQGRGDRLKAFTESQRAEEAAADETDEAEDKNLQGPQLLSGANLSALERLTVLSPETADSYLTALKAQYDYKTQGFAHRNKVFSWQYYSSIAIFAMVVGLVCAGFYFSWVQVQRDLQRDLGDTAAPEATELELSTSGLKVQSSILGVIILVVSLAFLYLYLVFVYPITEIL